MCASRCVRGLRRNTRSEKKKKKTIKWLNICWKCGTAAAPLYKILNNASEEEKNKIHHLPPRTCTKDEVSAEKSAHLWKQRTRGWHRWEALLCNYWLLGVILMHSGLADTYPTLEAEEEEEEAQWPITAEGLWNPAHQLSETEGESMWCVRELFKHSERELVPHSIQNRRACACHVWDASLASFPYHLTPTLSLSEGEAADVTGIWYTKTEHWTFCAWAETKAGKKRLANGGTDC